MGNTTLETGFLTFCIFTSKTEQLARTVSDLWTGSAHPISEHPQKCTVSSYRSFTENPVSFLLWIKFTYPKHKLGKKNVNLGQNLRYPGGVSYKIQFSVHFQNQRPFLSWDSIQSQLTHCTASGPFCACHKGQESPAPGSAYDPYHTHLL